MFGKICTGVVCLVTIVVTGCNSGLGAELENSPLLAEGTPFVLRGTAAVIDNGGPCPIWRGDNGETYHLFQAPTLENDAYDEVTQPGVTSRLVLVTRSDLTLDCQVGIIVQVRDVLDVEN
jgi:hypothetical protein